MSGTPSAWRGSPTDSHPVLARPILCLLIRHSGSTQPDLRRPHQPHTLSSAHTPQPRGVLFAYAYSFFVPVPDVAGEWVVIPTVFPVLTPSVSVHLQGLPFRHLSQQRRPAPAFHQPWSVTTISVSAWPTPLHHSYQFVPAECPPSVVGVCSL